MSAPGAGSATVSTSFSCTDEEYAAIRDRAEARGATVSAYVIERGLTVDVASDPMRSRAAHRLILSEQEQRELYAALKGAASNHPEHWARRLETGVQLLLDAVLVDMVWQGRPEQMRTLLAQLMEAPRATELAERLEEEVKLLGLVP